jgi:hypothetical protein
MSLHNVANVYHLVINCSLASEHVEFVSTEKNSMYIKRMTTISFEYEDVSEFGKCGHESLLKCNSCGSNYMSRLIYQAR